MADLMELTDENYADFIARQDGILLFYKSLCPHCKAIKKVMQRFAEKGSEALMAQIDTEANPQAVQALEVERVPTMILIKRGGIVGRKIGLLNVKELAELYKTI